MSGRGCGGPPGPPGYVALCPPPRSRHVHPETPWLCGLWRGGVGEERSGRGERNIVCEGREERKGGEEHIIWEGGDEWE